MTYNQKVVGYCLSLLTAAAALIGAAGPLQAQEKKPNIIVFMSDDVGIWNISAYHRGMMGGRTPNIDRVAKEGALFTDYYAQAHVSAKTYAKVSLKPALTVDFLPTTGDQRSSAQTE